MGEEIVRVAQGLRLFLGESRGDLGKLCGTTVREKVAKYTIILEPNYPEEGYTVRVPTLSGCITYGRTTEEALERAKEAVEGFIEGLQRFLEMAKEKHDG